MPDLPEVRQLTDPDSPHFGAIATPGTGAMTGQWFIGNGATGGGWAGEDAVDLEKGWEVLAPKPKTTTKKGRGAAVKSRS